MRILLISPNIEMLPDPVAPLGLAFLSAALKSAGHEVHCLDLCFAESVDAALGKSVLDFSPDVIALSLRNIDNVSYPESVSYLPFYKRVVEYCRQISASPIFLGGSGFTLMPGAILHLLRGGRGNRRRRGGGLSESLDGRSRLFFFSGRGFFKKGSGTFLQAGLHSEPGFSPFPGLGRAGFKPLLSPGRNGEPPDEEGMSFFLRLLHLSFDRREGSSAPFTPKGSSRS